VRIVATKSGTHATELAQQVAAEGADAVFAVGGDGTMGQVASGLVGSETALGILPSGTTNVLAVELGLIPFEWHRPWAMEYNASLLAHAPIRRVDAGLCNGKPFLLWAGFGLDGLTIRHTEPRPRLVKYVSVPHYFVEAVWQATGWNGVDVVVRAGENAWCGHIIQAVASNIRHYLGGMAELSPWAHLDDGLFDLWLLSGSNLGDSLRHAFGMMGGRHLTAEDAHRVTAQKLTVETERPVYIQLDGDPAGEASFFEIESLPGALKMLLPERALRLLKN
jgi:YegS/Rv2252/BmrU family lipid kinase